LAPLTQEDLYVLLTKVRHVYASGDPAAYLVPDEALLAFMQHCSERVGDAYFRTPRATIKAFCDLLAVLEQNPNASWREILNAVDIVTETNPDLAPLDDEPEDAEQMLSDDDDLASFRL
jgi:hypothetical protein